jgi:hypothetical protein
MVLILVAACMVALLLMAAFVIDIGAAQGERRQNQTAADSAALAGAQQLGAGTDVAANEAMKVARQNLSITYSNADWATLWNQCVDPDALPNFPATVATKCISFNAAYTRIRVRLPEQVQKTTFGGVAGINTISTNADATAQAKVIPGNGILPFAIAGFTDGLMNQTCLTDSGCNGGSQDTLLIVDSPLVGNAQYQTQRDCPPGNGAGLPKRIELNTAMGIDHALASFKKAGDVVRHDDCAHQLPNYVSTSSLSSLPAGNDLFKLLRVGMVTGPSSGSTYPDGKAARLRRIPPDRSDWKTRKVGGTTVDNRPLWMFIPTDATNIPTSCKRSAFDNGTGNPVAGGKDKMLKCLADYGTSTGYAPLFTVRDPDNPDGLYDIQLSARSAYVPAVASASSGWQPIESFKLFFIQSVYINGAGDSSAEAEAFNPGEGTSDISTDFSNFKGVSALRITDAMVPQQVRDASPNNQGRGVPLSLIQ